MAEQARPRVLHLIKGLGPGGAENLLLALAQRSPSPHPFDVVYLLPWKDHLVGDFERAGVVVHCLDAPRPVDPRWVQRLRRLVVRERYDIVHVHSPLPAAMARPALRSMRASGRPAIVSVEQNSWDSHHRATRWANAITLPLGDAWLAVSEETRQSMTPRHRGRVRVIPNGVDVPSIANHRVERDAVRAELGLGPDDVAVITVANLRRQKDYPNLLAAARKAVDRAPQLRFFAVGQGPLEEELRQRRDEMDLAATFTFLGYRDDVRRLLSGMDVYTQASAHEGIPLAVMEALAAGLPIVATAVGGTPDAVREGVTGVLVPSGDSDALAAEYVDLASDPARRAAMSAAALEDAMRFDIGEIALALDRVYTSVARETS